MAPGISPPGLPPKLALYCGGEMELTNAEREMLWIDGWNDIYDAIAKLPGCYLVNERWCEVTLDECQGLIQSTAYTTGKRVRFRTAFYRGKQSIQIYFDH